MARVLDVAALLPHGALRAYVLGEGRGNDEATDDEIALMRDLAREAIEAGAVGISTTRTILHRAKDGELAAGTTAAAEELIAIGDALGRRRPPGVLGGQRHARPRRRDRPGWPRSPAGPTSRSPSRPCRPTSPPTCWRTWIDGALRGQPAGRLARPAGGRQAGVDPGRVRVELPPVRPPRRPTRRIADLPLDERLAAPARPPRCGPRSSPRTSQPTGPGGVPVRQLPQAVPARRPARLRAGPGGQRRRHRRARGPHRRSRSPTT